MEPFPLFVGCGRSGTTLLRAMFDSHPSLAVSHELQFVGRMARRRESFETPAGLDQERFVARLLHADSFHLLDLTEDAVRRTLAAAAPDSYASAIRALMTAYATKRGKERYGDKTPGNVTRIPLLAELFPESRFVHIVRDGRDCMLAYRGRGFGPQTLEEAALNWRTRVLRGRAAGRALGPTRYTEVGYERLVEDPERELRRLCAFLDLDYDPAMLEFHRRSEDVLTAVRPSHAQVFENLSRPVTKGIRDWRKSLEPDEVRRFAALAGDVLVQFGYDAGAERLSLEERATALWYRGRWAARRGAQAGRTAARRGLKRLRAV